MCSVGKRNGSINNARLPRENTLLACSCFLGTRPLHIEANKRMPTLPDSNCAFADIVAKEEVSGHKRRYSSLALGSYPLKTQRKISSSNDPCCRTIGGWNIFWNIFRIYAHTRIERKICETSERKRRFTWLLRNVDIDLGISGMQLHPLVAELARNRQTRETESDAFYFLSLLPPSKSWTLKYRDMIFHSYLRLDNGWIYVTSVDRGGGRIIMHRLFIVLNILLFTVQWFRHTSTSFSLECSSRK